MGNCSFGHKTKGKHAFIRTLSALSASLIASIALVFAAADSKLVGAQSSSDRAALVALYNATGGENWIDKHNWLSDEPIGEWQGVTTNDEGRVSELQLWANNLTGAVPSELGNLSNLTLLALQDNQLTGAIPSRLGSLSNLRELVISGNQLSGSIPSELGNLSSLTILDLDSNQLSGSIPSELGSLSNLEKLDLSANSLTGTIPAELGNLSNLVFLNVHTNQLSGPIPSELSRLSSLEMLYLQENQLSGTIPSELGRLSILVELYLWTNQLSGEIPEEIGNLSSLTELALQDNQLSGAIPGELGNLANLRRLGLWGNQLTGNIPPEIGSMSSLTELWLGGNQLSGLIPPQLGNLSNLEDLQLQLNGVTGTIPSELGQLTSLRELRLQDNSLSGSIPPELGNLSNLELLWLSRNELTGAIPAELRSASNLQRLFLSDNDLTGEIPAELGNLSGLEFLYLEDNGLTGEVPTELGNLSKLLHLSFKGNQLSGAIPLSFTGLSAIDLFYFDDNAGLCATDDEVLQGWLQSIPERDDGPNCDDDTGEPDASTDREALVEFYNATDGDNWHTNTNWLSDRPLGEWYGVTTDDDGRVIGIRFGCFAGHPENNLSGTIPKELGNLSELQEMSLCDNPLLTGAMPNELGNLSRLQRLDLDRNDLTGTIPNELGALSELQALDLYGNRLIGALPQSFTGLASLEYFEFHDNDGLCAPLGTTFQDWLQSISHHAGPNCEDRPFILNWTPSATRVGMDESFTLTVAMSGAQQAGDHGGMSISFPSLTEADKSTEENLYSSSAADVQLIADDTTASNVTFYDSGDTDSIHDAEGGHLTPDHLLVELDDPSWSQDDARTLELRITPKQEGEFSIRIRGWICADEYNDCERQPESSDTTDLQGWPAEEVVVNVTGRERWLELAKKYAPVLRMHPGEKYFPKGVEALIDNAELKYHDEEFPHITVPYEGEVAPETLAPSTLDTFKDNLGQQLADQYDGANWYLDVPDSINSIPRTGYPPKVYATVRDHIPGKVYLQYYLFYYYDHLNPGFSQENCEDLVRPAVFAFVFASTKDPILATTAATAAVDKSCFPHEADWELIQLEFNTSDVKTILDEKTEPTRVEYSQHFWGEDSSYSDVPKVDGHPVAYIAHGKHANYLGPGPDAIIGGDPWSVSFVQDHISDRGKELLPPALSDYTDTCPDPVAADFHDCTYTYELEIIHDATPWVAYEGNWGLTLKEDGKIRTIQGPDHPARWDTPHQWGTLILDIDPDDLKGRDRDLLILQAAYNHWGASIAEITLLGILLPSGETELDFSNRRNELDFRSPKTIPPSLGDLADLRSLNLQGNGFTGIIPRQLGYLSELRELYLNDNNLTGEIPDQLGELQNLQALHLAGNDLTGCIPNGLKGVDSNDFHLLGLNFCDGTTPPEPPAAIDACTAQLTGDGSVSGTWDSDCQSLHSERSGSFSRFYTFSLVAESDVTISLQSDSIRDGDTYLYLRAGLNQKEGDAFMENDDHEDDTSNDFQLPRRASGITATLAPGDYTIEATTYHTGQTGEFTLTVTRTQGGSEMPRFTVETDLSEDSVEVGESFTLTVTMNSVGGAGEHGGISVSFPQLIYDGGDRQTHSSPIADVRLLSPNMSAAGVTFYQPGEGRIHRASDNRQITARRLLVESDESWSQGDVRMMQMEVTPKREGDFRVLVRGWMCESRYMECARQPETGLVVDQQGWPAEKLTLEVTPRAAQAAPDLIVDLQRATDRRLSPGERFAMSFRVLNRGNARSTANASLKYYRSSNATISTSDTEITDVLRTASVGPLDPGAKSPVVTIGLNAPSGGRYYYGVCVGTVDGESDTQNNCSAVLRVIVAEPDLVVVSPSVSDSDVDAGDRFEIGATVQNAGGLRSSRSIMRYYRSSDPTITTSDVRVLGSSSTNYDSIPVLDPGETSEESIRTAAPDSGGRYYYGACVEAVSGETRTNNNCSPGVPVTVASDFQGMPDLVPLRPRFSDYTPERGSYFRATVTIENEGNKQADGTTFQLWVSSDPETQCTRSLNWESEIRSIDAGEAVSMTHVNLYVSSYAGTYYYRVKVLEVEGESETTNNCSPATVVVVE